jgi:hypothetical protein
VKKIVVLILSFLYLNASSGAVIQFHYCMGKLISWEFGSKTTDECDNCGMHKTTEASNKCCKDLIKKIDSSKEHKQAESSFNTLTLNNVAIPVSSPAIPQIIVYKKENYNSSYLKRLFPEKNILELGCIFLI